MISVQVAKLLGLRQTPDERSRPDHPADAQSGKGDLRKTPDQNRPGPGAGDLADGRQRLAFVSERAVDIIFDQQDARVLGDTRNVLPGPTAQRNACGILKVRRDYGYPGPVIVYGALKFIRIHPAWTDRHADGLYSSRAERIPQPRLHRVLD